MLTVRRVRRVRDDDDDGHDDVVPVVTTTLRGPIALARVVAVWWCLQRGR
jgi:hypothetical protein